MRVSQFFLSTLKEAPSEAELVSHKLMLRAGLIKRLASGVYTWMPLGLRVLRKVETIVREEMNRSGAIELLMPAVQPAELWQESGRWEQYGPELLRIKDRHERDFCFGPTHEEVVSDIVRREIKSYRQLPINLYQIQTKFRDEIRPRFGVMRGREFVMKDAYSFHADKASLERDLPRHVRLPTRASSRGSASSSAQWPPTPARSAAPARTNSTCLPTRARTRSRSARIRITRPTSSSPKRLRRQPARAAPTATLERVHTPGVKTIAELGAFLKIPAQKTVKAVVVDGADGRPVLLLVRGDHELNLIKAGKLAEVRTPVAFASA